MKQFSLVRSLLEFHIRLKEADGNYTDPNWYKKYQKKDVEPDTKVPTWTDVTTGRFAKGYKKYQNDKEVMKNYDWLRNTIMSFGNKMPHITDYPSKLRVHTLNPDNRFPKAALGAHLKNRKIIVVFSVDYKNNVINWLYIGTHQGAGWR